MQASTLVFARSVGLVPFNAALVFFLLLIAGDMGFVLIHVVQKLWQPAVPDPLFWLGQDGGYAEMFQYLKLYWVTILFGALWARTREPVYAGWTLLYAYLLCDDALRIHEGGGGAIAAAWGYQPMLGLRAQDFGELTVSVGAGIVFLALIYAGYLRSTRRARDVSIDLALLFGLLVFFGVFLDMLPHLAPHKQVKWVLGTIEDAGEMFTVSLVCWYMLGRSSSAPAALWPTVLQWLSARRTRPG